MIPRLAVCAAFSVVAGATALSAAAPVANPVVHPALWPEAVWPVATKRDDEARIAALLQHMTVEEKVGQVIQADIGSVTPDDVRRYHLGSILNGGNSGPGGDDFALAPN